MSLFPVKIKRDSVNGGSYDYRQKSAVLWRDALESGHPTTYDNGYKVASDMSAVTTGVVGTGGWLVSDIGTVTPSAFLVVAAQNGVGRLSTGATTVGEGVQACLGAPSGLLSTASNRVIGEVALDLGTISPSFFIGAINTTSGADLALTVTTGARNTAKSHIGFYRVSAAGTLGDLYFTSKLEGSPDVTTEAVVLTAAQMAALAVVSTKLNLGFAINQHNTVDVVVNGERYKTVSDTITQASLPAITEYLSPVIVTQDYITSGALGAVAIDCDWYQFWQG